VRLQFQNKDFKNELWPFERLGVKLPNITPNHLNDILKGQMNFD
jgi:hypothetical protein